MASVFSRIISGELPGQFVWRDDLCAVFLTIAPITVGHALVVPRAEIDQWIDLPVEIATHLMTVAQAIGQAQRLAFSPVRIGLIIAGLEVSHVHLHVLPIERERDLNFERARQADPSELGQAAAAIRVALRDLGFAEVAD